MSNVNSPYKPAHYLFAFILIEAFLFIFYPQNRTEVDDGYWYAQLVRDEEISNLFNPRFMVFLPLVKILYQASNSLLGHIDAYSFMSSLSIVLSGITIVLLFDVLRKNLNLNFHASLIGSLLLLFSYEYWRYSYEAEVYIISILLILFSFRLHLSSLQNPQLKKTLILAIIGVSAALIYKLNAIPVFIAFPLIYIWKKRIKEAVLLCFTGAALFILSTFLIHHFFLEDHPYLNFLLGGINDPAGSPFLSVFVVASNFISVLWIFANDHVVSIVKNAFPHKIMDEEILIAKQVGLWESILWLLSFILLVLFIALTIKSFKAKRSYNALEKDALLSSLIWLIVYSIVLMVLDPSSNEPWLMVQLPLAILLTLTLKDALNRSGLYIFYTALGILLFINLAGGILLLQNQHYNYNRKKSEWLINNAQAEDTILSYGPISLIRFLRYYSKAEVISIEENPELAYKILENGSINGDVYITNDVMDVPVPFIFRSGEKVRKVKNILDSKSIEVVLVNQGAVPTYEVK